MSVSLLVSGTTPNNDSLQDAVKATGAGVRIVACPLPIKSPWLNPIEPKWVHGKKRVVEPARLLTLEELECRVYAALGADHADHLTMPKHAA